jgi:NADPH:quinone reductase-like Zn-dependent oxidoreductase
VGAGVSNLAPGAKVMGATRFGAYATHVVVPRDQLFRVPRGFDEAQSGGFLVAFLTAYYALFELAAVRAGMKVLVHSAAGGVGGALLQLAKIAGAKVVGVVGASDKVESAARLGADVVIDKSRQDLWGCAREAAPRGYDAIFDANGVATLAESFRHLGTPGRLVIYGFHTMMSPGRGKPNWPKLALDWLRTPRFDPLTMTNENKSVMGFNLSYMFEKKGMFLEPMERLVGWVEEGKIVAPHVRTFPLDQVADAHRAIESGRTVGKLVLDTRD